MTVWSSVADLERFDADPDPTFHADADPNFFKLGRENLLFFLSKSYNLTCVNFLSKNAGWGAGDERRRMKKVGWVIRDEGRGMREEERGVMDKGGS